jgi:glucosamine-6-phosphate deaminase
MIFALHDPKMNFWISGSIRRIDWRKITAFHMDEYIGLDALAPQRFGNYLKGRIFGRVPFGRVHYLNPSSDNPQAECERYTTLLHEAPVDLICMGIGENGHIAFNDPPVAVFMIRTV